VPAIVDTEPWWERSKVFVSIDILLPPPRVLLSWRGTGAASSFNGRGLVIEQVA
jgi:hypothetical protein